MRHILYFIAALLLAYAPEGRAQDLSLPAAISSQVGESLKPVGSGNYSKLGFNIYQARLWAPQGDFKRSEPYALQVEYKRDLSKDTMVDAVMEDIRAQKKADATTMDKWESQLARVMPAVRKGDELVGVSEPGKPARLFYNGQQIASISDKRLAESFFNIWLGPVADATLRAQLTGQG